MYYVWIRLRTTREYDESTSTYVVHVLPCTCTSYYGTGTAAAAALVALQVGGSTTG